MKKEFISLMTAFFSNKFKLLLMSITFYCSCIATAQNFPDEAYAKKLFQEEDYFRSISEWKKIDYYSADIEKKILAQKYISYCYLLSNKNKTSLQYLFHLLELEQADSEKDFTLFLIGLNYYSMQLSIIMQNYYDKLTDTNYEWSYLPMLFRISFALKNNQFEDARKYLNHSSLISDSAINIREFGFTVFNEIKEAPYYDPFLISITSAIIPGAGQAIAGHIVDALQAFSLIGMFGFTTYGLYLYDSNISHNYIATGIGAGVTLIFYIANVIGAYKTAENRNQYERKNVIKKWEERIWLETKKYLNQL